jgi:hypothetical protein
VAEPSEQRSASIEAEIASLRDLAFELPKRRDGTLGTMTACAPSLGEIERLKTDIERIRTLDLDGLRVQWRNVFARRAPRTLPRGLLVRVLAYRVQADALGDLDPKVLQVLEGFAARDSRLRPRARADGRYGAAPSFPSPRIKPGSVLVREWAGRTHRVMALEVGFAWEGKTYRSLSHVARAITGTQWNGRRFFGVDRPKEAPNSMPDARPIPAVRVPNERGLQP